MSFSLRCTFRAAIAHARPLTRDRAHAHAIRPHASRIARASASASSNEPPLENITVKDLQELLEVADDDVVFVDVRERDEWDAGHLPRFELKALSAAGEWLPTMQKEVKPDAKVVVMCKLGGRSMRASEALVQMGFTNVKNVVGGYEGYKTDVGA
jgi:rhodanese-related sulfurtransferase